MAVAIATVAAVIMAVADTTTAEDITTVEAARTITAATAIAGMDITTRTLVVSGTVPGMRMALAPAGVGRTTTMSMFGFAIERPKRLASEPRLSRAAMLHRGPLLFGSADTPRWTNWTG